MRFDRLWFLALYLLIVLFGVTGQQNLGDNDLFGCLGDRPVGEYYLSTGFQPVVNVHPSNPSYVLVSYINESSSVGSEVLVSLVNTEQQEVTEELTVSILSSNRLRINRNPAAVYNPIDDMYYVVWQSALINSTRNNVEWDIYGMKVYFDVAGGGVVYGAPLLLDVQARGPPRICFNPDDGLYAITFDKTRVQSPISRNTAIFIILLTTEEVLVDNYYVGVADMFNREPDIAYENGRYLLVFDFGRVDADTNFVEHDIASLVLDGKTGVPVNDAVHVVGSSNLETADGQLLASGHDHHARLTYNPSTQRFFLVYEVDALGANMSEVLSCPLDSTGRLLGGFKVVGDLANPHDGSPEVAFSPGYDQYIVVLTTGTSPVANPYLPSNIRAVVVEERTYNTIQGSFIVNDKQLDQARSPTVAFAITESKHPTFLISWYFGPPPAHAGHSDTAWSGDDYLVGQGARKHPHAPVPNVSAHVLEPHRVRWRMPRTMPPQQPIQWVRRPNHVIRRRSQAFVVQVVRGVSNGVERGVSNGVERGVSNGVERGVSNGVERGAWKEGIVTRMVCTLMDKPAQDPLGPNLQPVWPAVMLCACVISCCVACCLSCVIALMMSVAPSIKSTGEDMALSMEMAGRNLIRGMDQSSDELFWSSEDESSDGAVV